MLGGENLSSIAEVYSRLNCSMARESLSDNNFEKFACDVELQKLVVVIMVEAWWSS